MNWNAIPDLSRDIHRAPVVHGFRRLDAVAYNLVKKNSPNTVFAAANGPVYADEPSGEQIRCYIKLLDPPKSANVYLVYMNFSAFEVSNISAATGGMIVNIDYGSAAWDPTALTWNTQPTMNSLGNQLLEFTSSAMSGRVPYADANFKTGFAYLGVVGNSPLHGFRVRVDNATLAVGERRSIAEVGGVYVFCK